MATPYGSARSYLPQKITIGDDSHSPVGRWDVVLKVIRDQGERIRALEDQVQELIARRS